jgi:CubicO group peptidase (beta-lactamase class C family)
LPQYKLDRRITVRMLLQHTSGLFNYTGEYYDDGTVVPGIPATGDEWLANRFRSHQPEELVRLALSKTPRFEPGTGQNYSNTNYTLALLLIEKVTGRSYAEQLQQRILRPLGMSGTMAAATRTQLPGPHAHGYYQYEDDGRQKVADISRQNLSLLAGAGDLIATTQDLDTFFSALNAGKLFAGHAAGRDASAAPEDGLRPRAVRTGPGLELRHRLPTQRQPPARLRGADVQLARRQYDFNRLGDLGGLRHQGPGKGFPDAAGRARPTGVLRRAVRVC